MQARPPSNRREVMCGKILLMVPPMITEEPQSLLLGFEWLHAPVPLATAEPHKCPGVGCRRRRRTSHRVVQCKVVELSQW